MAARTGNEHKLWRVPIWDVTLPSFASGASCVYGTEEDLGRFMSVRKAVLENSPLGDSDDDELLQAYGRWLDGEDPTTHVAYQEQPFAETAGKVVSTVRVVDKRHNETHDNTYGFPYEIHAESVTYDVLLLETGGRCLRLIKADVRGMTIGSDAGVSRLVDSSWGEPGVLAIRDGGNLSTTVFLVESCYDDVNGALEATLRKPSLSLAPVMDHIVADG